MDFLKNLNLEDHGKPGQERGLFDKLGALQSQIQSHSPASSPAAPKHDNLLGKIGDVLHHASAPTPAPAPPSSMKHDDSLIGKIGKISNALSGEKPASAQGKGEGLLGKLNSAIGGKQEPAKPQSLGGKLNHALGGGAAGEQKEDVLDKAIDLFQEHVLKQGPQNNESAIEQLKDKQIADAIKHQFKNVTGKEFPGTKK
ncbi:hypothetical protein BDZ94DRAFT_1323711 [Collybia nuda]|uniref:Uncharacterized protein n=1 Tax=Collybia nuda TaxID=64659 RepID=A0A9P6CCN7_9AGAR|nr:hypothetical protein BDZ94DRAFT_1323711 [Collybia nuda]